MAPAVLAALELLLLLLLLCTFGVAPLAAASGEAGFLSARDARDALEHGPADLLAKLEQLDQLAAASSDDYSFDARAERLEEALRPLFKLSPKDATGRLDAKAARYVLHRVFIQRHAWHVSGIELQSAVRNTSRVRRALHTGGNFSLRQLARFAATLESLVHADDLERLQRTFSVLQLPQTTPGSVELAKRVAEAYIVILLKPNMNLTASIYPKVKRSFEMTYSPWNDTKLFTDEMCRTVFERMDEGKPLSLWEASVQVVEEIGERYGRIQGKICRGMKARLLGLEVPGTGRVPLSAFWGGALTDPQWYFTESLSTLQRAGAVEGEAPHYFVLIPNYLNAASNCREISKYHDSCCSSECETVLSEIENRVDAMAATPHRLAELVRTVSSATVSAPVEVSATLLHRLEEGATVQYGGLVPLHSRLFAQFLHHVYPRECPYPHVSADAFENMDEWVEPAVVESSTLVDFCTASSTMDSVKQLSNEFPWTNEEELFMQSFWPTAHVVSDRRFETSTIIALSLLSVSLPVSVVVRAFVSSSVCTSSKASAHCI